GHVALVALWSVPALATLVSARARALRPVAAAWLALVGTQAVVHAHSRFPDLPHAVTVLEVAALAAIAGVLAVRVAAPAAAERVLLLALPASSALAYAGIAVLSADDADRALIAVGVAQAL